MQTQGRTNRRVVRGVTMALVMLAVACGAQKQTSDFKHDLNHPTNNDVGSQWQVISDTDLKKVVMPIYASINGGEPVQLLDQENAIVTRLQYWVDKFHANLLAAHPEEMKDVVKPKVQVIITEDPNAFVMPVPVCHDVKVIIDADAEESRTNTVDAIGIKSNGTFGRPMSSRICVKGPTDEAFLKQFVADYNKNDLPCQLTLKSTDDQIAIVAGERCSVEEQFAGVAVASKLVRQPVAGIITVHSGIIPMMNEEELVSVIAHELGHYYKVHTDHPHDSSYDFFYTLKQENPSSKPTAEGKLNEAGQAAVGVKIPNRRYRKVEGQQYRTELFVPLMSMGTLINKRQECSTDEGTDAAACNTACKDFAEYVADRAFRSALGDFPFGPLNADGKKAYKKFEEKAEACFKPVSIGTEKVKQGLEIAEDDVTDSLVIDRNIGMMFNGTEVSGKMSGVFESAVKSLEKSEKTLAEPLHEAARKAIGFYTAEQEADELSVEWMADIGLAPTSVIEAEFRLGEFVHKLRTASGAQSLPTEMNIERCKELYKNEWRDENGKYFIVPIGDYVDTHHSSCFRAFNADREIKAHKLKPAVIRHDAPGGSWEDMRKAVAKLHEDKRNLDALRTLFELVFPADESDLDNEEINAVRDTHASCKFSGNHTH